MRVTDNIKELKNSINNIKTVINELVLNNKKLERENLKSILEEMKLGQIGVVSGNTAENGGGIYNESNSPTITNVTVSGNSSSREGGGIYNKTSYPILINAISWGNAATEGYPEIRNDRGSISVISHSLIAGSGGSAGWNPLFGTDGGFNIDADPLFVDQPGGDLRLNSGSPAIDSGDNGVPNLPSLDLDGYVRIFRSVVDMGPYEFEARLSAVDDPVGESIPRATRLYQAYPNPFNPMTTIAFDLPRSERVSLRIYDISGSLVRVLVNDELVSAGRQEAIWRGRDRNDRPVAAGVYFYRLEAGGYGETKRMVMIK